MAASGKVSGAVSLFSLISAWSLIVFGGLSLLIAAFSWSWAGAFIGLALLIHGILENRFRGSFLPQGERSFGKRLAWNQVGLAASGLLYFSWQLASFDRTALDAMLARDPLHTLLEQSPPEVSDMFYRDFPKLLAGAYGIAGMLVLLGCLGMAFMYLKASRK
ncbi:hypothetical protein [Pelagicoccus sp. SDUM812002]|uniref:hypothetical protein n=1 Tax=Pelagicoccus sp. SDUM812002 TaxID=3041266 RepID=UPI00280E31D2|nr:hypothetical protein [Pelagicoccus sp. SDUM812002]MDQ8184473.1 hypothetical protein [Pelagicoccus sp. SDUM812002]